MWAHVGLLEPVMQRGSDEGAVGDGDGVCVHFVHGGLGVMGADADGRISGPLAQEQ